MKKEDVVKMNHTLDGKSVYAFGDSILYGHNQPEKSMLRLMAEQYSWKLSIFAKNGATILLSENQVLQQVLAAPEAPPDLIVFDGYTNDAYGPKETDPFNRLGEKTDITARYGVIQGSGAATFDHATFCGAFEELLNTMKQKWSQTGIIYLTIHKSGGRDFSIQSRLHELTVKMCASWGVTVADMFTVSELDTRHAEEMQAYILGGSGSHPNESCCRKFYIPMLSAMLTSLLAQEMP